MRAGRRPVRYLRRRRRCAKSPWRSCRPRRDGEDDGLKPSPRRFAGGQRRFIALARARLQKFDDVGAILGLIEMIEHFGAGEKHLRIGEPFVEMWPRPTRSWRFSARRNRRNRAGTRPCGRTRRDGAGRRRSCRANGSPGSPRTKPRHARRRRATLGMRGARPVGRRAPAAPKTASASSGHMAGLIGQRRIGDGQRARAGDVGDLSDAEQIAQLPRRNPHRAGRRAPCRARAAGRRSSGRCGRSRPRPSASPDGYGR